MFVNKAQRAVHTAGLVAVHATGDQHGGQFGVPVAAANGQQGKALVRIGHLTVARHVKTLAQALDAAKHIVGITALAHLAHAPLGQLGRPPGQAHGADGVKM